MKTRFILFMMLIVVPATMMPQNLYLDNIQKAGQGDAEAQNNIGRCYSLGIGVEKDSKQALNWFKKSAAQGYTKGIINCGVCYQQDWKFTKARSCFEEALKKRDISAYYFLGNLYSSPVWTDGIDLKKSLGYFQQGAAVGDFRSQYQLAYYYKVGVTELARDEEKALYWYDQVISNTDQRLANKAANDACYLCIIKGEFDKAIQYADIAIEKNRGKDVNDYDTKGDAYIAGLERQNKSYSYKNKIDSWYKDFAPLKAYGYYEGAKQMLAKCLQMDANYEKKNTAFVKKMKELESTPPEWLKDTEVMAALHKPSEGVSSESLVQQTPVGLQASTLQQSVAIPVSMVDENIPVSSQTDENVFVVIIGNEKYEEEAEVPFAENDAKVFYEYCRKTLGISEKHIRLYLNAGYNNIRKAVSWLKQGMTAYGESGRIIFYYAGHGIPNETDKSAYLLPVDGIGRDTESAYSLSKLYQTLGEIPAQSVTVFLDACFSGAKRDGQMMSSARGVAIKAKPQEAKGNMVIFTAAQGDETAYPFKSQKHGMFTYYLLKKLQETQGDVTLGELGDYLTNEVKRESFDENNKIQTPTVIPSSAMMNQWRTMKLK